MTILPTQGLCFLAGELATLKIMLQRLTKE